MPRRNDTVEKSEIMKVRLNVSVRERCNEVRMAGAHSDEPESTFLGYLVRIGLAKYQACILPVETAQDDRQIS